MVVPLFEKKCQPDNSKMSGKNGDLETSTLLENGAMPKVADTFAGSADPDLVDMVKGIIGRNRDHSHKDFRTSDGMSLRARARAQCSSETTRWRRPTRG